MSGLLDDLPCSVAATDIGEEPEATAPYAVSWLGLVVPGAWARDALALLPPELRAALASVDGVRPVVLRPAARTRTDVGMVLAGTVPGRSWLRYVDDVDVPAAVELLTAEDGAAVAALAEGRAPRLGRAVNRFAVLVCTNGTRDACCARLGRPAVQALAARVGEPRRGVLREREPLADVWESSHLGGHRFAPTAVVLPHGMLLGGLGPDPGPLADAVEGVLVGRTVLDGYRGRSTWTAPEQAAETAVRRHLAVVGVSAGPDDVVVDGSVPVEAVSGRAGGSWRVLVRHSGGRTFRVVVHRSVMEPGRPASCGAGVTPVVLWDSEVDPDAAPGLYLGG